MVKNKIQGSLLLKLGLVLAVLAGVAVAILVGVQRTARVKLVERGDAVDAVTGTVFVDAEGGTNKELKAEADGKVVECDKMVVGQHFKKGDILVQLDTVELERLIEETERKYFDDKRAAHIELTGGKPELLANVEKLSDEDRAKLYRDVSPARKLLVEKLEDVTRLHTLGNVSDEEKRSAERALETFDVNLQLSALRERRAEMDFKSTRANFDLQRERMQVPAPADGEIVEVYVWEGALIGRGVVVGKFMTHDRVVSAKISEESFGKVRVGQRARVRLLTYGEQNFDATVSKLLPKADDAQRFTVFLDVKVDRPEQLKPGSTGEVTITVDQRQGSMMIARRGLFDGDKVYVVKDGRVEKRQVKVGFLALNVAEILSGVEVGEAVIVDELDRFREGDRVRTVRVP